MCDDIAADRRQGRRLITTFQRAGQNDRETDYPREADETALAHVVRHIPVWRSAAGRSGSMLE